MRRRHAIMTPFPRRSGTADARSRSVPLFRPEAVYTVPVGKNVPAGGLHRTRNIVNDTVKEQLNEKSIKYNWHEADVTVLEGVLARGDRKIGQAILKVYETGGIFDAWSEYFDYQRWLDAFRSAALIPIFTRCASVPWTRFSHGILSIPA